VARRRPAVVKLLAARVNSVNLPELVGHFGPEAQRSLGDGLWSSPMDPAKGRVTLLSCQAQGFSAPHRARGAEPESLDPAYGRFPPRL
jgi:hypothetical protein